MAGRGKTTFQKRQKEQKRLERRQDKAARKLERKALKDSPPVEGADELLVEGADELLVEGADESPFEAANEPQLPAPPTLNDASRDPGAVPESAGVAGAENFRLTQDRR